MSDMTALAQKLNALAAKDDKFDDGARIISQGGTPDPLLAVLTAIDDTILERRLDFVAGDSVISVIAAGRRLRGLISATPDSPDIAAIAGTTLSRQEPELLDTAFGVLTKGLGSTDHLTVRSLPSEPFGSGGERGIAATTLAQMWQIELNAAPLPKMERFLQNNAAIFSAFLFTKEGEIVASDGDAAELQTIWDTQVAAYLATNQKIPGHDDGPQLVCLEGALGDDRAAALAIDGNDAALIACGASQLDAIHTSWHAIYR